MLRRSQRRCALRGGIGSRRVTNPVLGRYGRDMWMTRNRPIRVLAAALALSGTVACNEPLEFFGPGAPSVLNPSIFAVGSASTSPSGYLGIFAEPSDASQRFEYFHRVPITVISPTGDSITIELGPRYCEVAPRAYSVCREYVLILDTTVAPATVRGRLRAAGYVINMIGDNRYAVAYDVLGRAHNEAEIASVPYVLVAGNNSIGWLDLPPTDLGGKGLYGAVELTREPSPVDDHLLSVPDTGSVVVRYRQPNGTMLSERVSFTPRF